MLWRGRELISSILSCWACEESMFNCFQFFIAAWPVIRIRTDPVGVSKQIRFTKSHLEDTTGLHPWKIEDRTRCQTWGVSIFRTLI
jgi:hypothetical protein